MVSTQRALQILKKFERLNIPHLGISEKYFRILGHYGREVEMTARIYSKNKDDPPVGRDMPPIAGEALTYMAYHNES